MEGELTEEELRRVAKNRDQAIQLRLSQVVANDRDVRAPVKTSNLNRNNLSQGGFIPEEIKDDRSFVQFEKDEEFSDPELEDNASGRVRRKRRRLAASQPSSSSQVGPSVGHDLPYPLDQERPTCDTCSRRFDVSFLRRHFDVDVCDRCRDSKSLHALITKSTAKDRYLLNDVDLDVREPQLRFLLKKNPHNACWGDMRLYLEAQVAERALSVWGSEEALEAERERRQERVEAVKLKRYSRKIKGICREFQGKILSHHLSRGFVLPSHPVSLLSHTHYTLHPVELQVQTRSSLYTKTTASHEHTFGPETYDADKDAHCKSCTQCNYVVTFEKM